MVEHEWCGNDTVLNFCSRYLVEEAELNNATFDAANSVKVRNHKSKSIQLFAHIDSWSNAFVVLRYCLCCWLHLQHHRHYRHADRLQLNGHLLPHLCAAHGHCRSYPTMLAAISNSWWVCLPQLITYLHQKSKTTKLGSLAWSSVKSTVPSRWWTSSFQSHSWHWCQSTDTKPYQAVVTNQSVNEDAPQNQRMPLPLLYGSSPLAYRFQEWPIDISLTSAFWSSLTQL